MWDTLPLTQSTEAPGEAGASVGRTGTGGCAAHLGLNWVVGRCALAV